MRALFFFLVLANILFALWAQLLDVRTERLATEEPTRAPRIALASEIATDSATKSEPADHSKDESASEPPIHSENARCVSIGPFPELAQAKQAAERLQAAGFASRDRTEQGEIWIGHWVSIANLPTRQDAEGALQLLKAHNITDAYILPPNESGHVLSVGVFADQRRALNLVDLIRQLGLEPQLSDRKQPGTVAWLDVDLAEPGQRIDTSILQTEGGKILRLESRLCSPAVEADVNTR